MRHRRARVAGIAGCAAMLLAGSAGAETLTYTTPGTTSFVLPAGVGTVHVVAVGGRGGGLAGGHGAVVSSDVGVRSNAVAGRPTEIRITVAGNGEIGVAGAGGGGAAGFGPPLPTLAGGGGGASRVEVCTSTAEDPSPCAATLTVVAGGGGGAGAEGLPGLGGAGGSAGSALGNGASGTAAALLTAAGGGSAGAFPSAAGGAGAVSGNLACESGETGGTGTTQAGGAGGLSTDLAGHGDAGGGGGGIVGGGGGGGGAYCANDTGTSGGGGGAGASQRPGPGTIAIDATGQPSVTLTYEPSRPSVTIRSPRDGSEHLQGSRARVIYRCSPSFFLRTSIVSCTGPVRSGGAIDTTTLGDNAFTVSATDSLGLSSSSTVHYRVVDRTRARIARLRIRPRTIDLAARHPSATVRFALSEPSEVAIAVRRARSARSSRATVRSLAGVLGRNRFTLRTRIGRRTLRPGAYRLVLVATDPSGNRSRPAVRRFRVVDSDA